MSEVVHVQPAEVPPTEELRAEQPDTPAVGRWYSVTSTKRDAEGEEKKIRRTACVTELGSNYVELTYVGSESTTRIHNDEFWS